MQRGHRPPREEQPTSSPPGSPPPLPSPPHGPGTHRRGVTRPVPRRVAAAGRPPGAAPAAAAQFSRDYGAAAGRVYGDAPKSRESRRRRCPGSCCRPAGRGGAAGAGPTEGGGARLGLGAGPDRVSGRSMGCSYPYLGQGRPSVGHGYGKIHMERRPKVGQGLWGTDPGRAGRPGSAQAGPNLGGPPWPHPAALQAGVPQAQAGLLSALCHSCHTAFWDY